ncbi:hypothetical protein [Natronobacterium lacisalsi]|uniref:hypothetical protein n=1 Tax=Natronobacterium lacisalsi TaxID=229731 RepID=UPI00187DAD27|nr:hypothetical protein [Halobiforma lacisalsi]
MQMKEIADGDDSRRTVLKAITSGSVALVSVTGNATAAGFRFAGLAYDTLTHQTAGAVSGNVNSSNNELSGSIRIAGYTLPLSEVDKNVNSIRDEYIGIFDDEEYLREYADREYPLKLNLIRLTEPERFAGTLSRPSSKWGEIGFYLIPQEDFKYDKTVRMHSRRQDWEESELNFTIPDEGLPTDTGSKRFVDDLEPVRPGVNKYPNSQKVELEESKSEKITSQAEYVDTGILDEKPWDGEVDNRECSYQEPSWKLAAGVTGRGTEEEDYYQIEDGNSAIWEFHMHFTQRPDGHLIADNCSADPEPPYGKPKTYQFHIEIGDNEVRDNLYFEDPVPNDNDGESGNDLLGLGFEFTDAVYGNIYTSLGSALYDLNQSGGADVDKRNQGEEMYFDIPLDQDPDNLPTGDTDEEVASVQLRVNNEYDSGTHSVVVHPSFGFTLPGTPNGGGLCYCEYNSPIGFNTAPKEPLEVEYEVKS